MGYAGTSSRADVDSWALLGYNLLTGRELEILGLIADRLVLARSTVKKHVANIYAKLGVHHRTEVVVKARELQIL